MLTVAVTKPNQLNLVELPDPVPGPYEARIKTEAAALCNATDRKLIEGHFPGVEQYPLLLGHETVGIVDAIGSKVRSFKVGDRVIGGLLLNTIDLGYASGWGGFSQYTLAGDHQAMVADSVADEAHGWYEVYEIMRAVRPSLTIEDALLLCTWREVYGAFGDFNLQPGDDLLIYGAGPVGLSFVKFARLLDIGFIASVDLIPEKRQKALEMGADVVYAPDDPGLVNIVAKRGKRFDVIIDAVGKEGIINAALPMVKMAGSVCVYGVIDTQKITIDKAAAPYNFNLLIHQWPTRFREAAAQEPLSDWIETGQLSYKDFVSAKFPFNEVGQAFELSNTGRTIKTILRF